MSTEDEQYLEEIKELKKQVKTLQQQNVQKVQGLASFGRNVNGEFLSNLKVDVFIELFLDDKAKLQYVLALETRLQEELNAALSQVRTEQIATPQTKLIIPK